MEHIASFIILVFIIVLVCEWLTIPFKIDDTNKLLKELIQLKKEDMTK